MARCFSSARVLLAAGLLALGSGPSLAEPPAKQLFGAAERPADLKPAAIGSYVRGCLAGGVAMPTDGPTWQVMRLSRNRNWGHPKLIDFLQWLSREAAEKDGWPGLLVGDISQPRGGPMLTGHASHQIGLDADIWLMPMPDRRFSAKEREALSATAVVEDGPWDVYADVWTEAHHRLLRRAASHPGVERILVGPGIKKALCENETGDKSWLSKIRPWWGHNYHFHVRMSCPPGSPGCKPQGKPPAGSGCGAPLAYWLGPEPWVPKPAKEKPPVTLSGLPRACSNVLKADATPGTAAAPQAFARQDAPPIASGTSALFAAFSEPRLIERDVPRPRPSFAMN